MSLRDDTNWAELYQALGIDQGGEWTQVQAAYRRMAQSRHPDRFKEGTPEHRDAQGQIIEINQAYAKLSAYYKAHGHLPGQRYSAPRADWSSDVSQQSRANSAIPRTGAGWRMSPKHEKKTLLRRRSTILLALGLAYGAYQFWPPDTDFADPADEYELVDQGTNPEPVAPPSSLLGSSPVETNSGSSFFGPGSTMGEVHAVQGNPTRTSGSTWYYGNSSVTFVNGTVNSWNNDPDFPLKIRINPEELNSRTRHSRLTSRFTYGSTKADVEAVQGPPMTKNDDVWDYGVSRVFFKHNHVVRWVNSPMQPLKVDEPR